MNKKRRIILRTETFERISLRQTSKTVNRQTFAFDIYKIEISKVDAEGRQIIFEAKIHGSLEIRETSQKLHLFIEKAK